MLVVVALGGNALIRRGEPLTAEVQRTNLARAAGAIAAVAREHRVVLTHGNGPQVGLLALQNESFTGADPYPLDVLDAESEGMVGYLLAQQLQHVLPDQPLATVLTQVVVDAADPAFDAPSKPIGPVYDQPTARRLAGERGWTIAPDGASFRRVVPSPRPQRIVELGTVQLLLEAGVLVTCAGGGGIPVVERGRCLEGVEAVIDKDQTAALLAREVGADALLLLTDVDGVYDGWGTDHQVLLRHPSVADLRAVPAAPGSMGPKIDAVCRFAEESGGLGAIGRLEDATAILRGDAGTVVRGAG